MKRLLLILSLLAMVSPIAAQDEPMSPALEAQLDDLVTITERLRRLDTEIPVERNFPTRQETIDYLTEVYARDLPDDELERSRLLYVALGLLPEDIDLRAVYLNLLGSQVAGFYDPDTQMMNVIPTVGDDVGQELSLTEQIIFVHEYTHALQDQYFGLDMLDEIAADASPDRSLAALSLVEGDASATMNVYSQEVMASNPAAAFQLLAESAMAGNLMLPDDVPTVLVNELLFPYEAGMEFVVALYNEGGWEAINAAYDNLPQTTEQIIHPEKYLSGEVGEVVQPISVPAAEGWDEIWSISLGEFYLREHLRTQLGSSQSRRAAAGWGGDLFQVYADPDSDDLLWTLEIAWDTPQDAVEFTDAYADFGANKFESDAVDGCWSNTDEALCLISTNGRSLIISAPTVDMALSITQEQPTA